MQTEEWFNSRLGWVTASRLSDVMAKTKSGLSASRKNYMAEKISEILTGERTESFTSPAMTWGIETEPLAIAEYEARTFSTVTPAGFVPHPSIHKAGASPDGLVKDGLIEIKCPNTSTHIETILSKKIDRKYMLQMQFQMACTNREWCDFVSYDPRLPEYMSMVIIRVARDKKLIAEIEDEIIIFIDELNETIKKLKEAASENEN